MRCDLAVSKRVRATENKVVPTRKKRREKKIFSFQFAFSLNADSKTKKQKKKKKRIERTHCWLLAACSPYATNGPSDILCVAVR